MSSTGSPAAVSATDIVIRISDGKPVPIVAITAARLKNNKLNRKVYHHDQVSNKLQVHHIVLEKKKFASCQKDGRVRAPTIDLLSIV